MAGSGQGGRLSAAMALERSFFWDGAVFQQVYSVEVLFLRPLAAFRALVLGPWSGSRHVLLRLRRDLPPGGVPQVGPCPRKTLFRTGPWWIVHFVYWI